MKLLHLDASILPEDSSVSRTLSAAVVAHVRALQPDLTVTRRDLVAHPLSHMTLANLPPDHPASVPGNEVERAESQAVLEEFLTADIVVIGAPMYNFTIPTQLKSWLDRVLVPGRTFKYGPEGVKGLVEGKRVIVALSRGSFYGQETPYATAEHTETYLRTALGFIGIATPEVIVAEGVSRGEDQRAAAIEAAHQTVAALRV
ncbi:NAD(P)H dehydrogenase (quinone) [Gluconacetobacter diazotrophicus PA1 5]|uniref:FMN-dependent NADH:quinone oxidoreductase n=2 Tax=Gluconacetobacter diazotrophicus TaxID=33996 RepID=AZOR_GLUDA|nr:NAD(P)H-dependent oxidoreductase [Gluconacetobacter diazotrophicus]A9H9I9.1 RecName: Full=FMN-dependent NADH:quinone oxidoreductase; AltName: Full=Azo-dye reductase; AltName: Full=FMN-dependent NADH-azo compound oxidoreductase; AltName: Full=FMN-dependent NADH-azoreductase [Gluconacetobacter diazotrophicus PA1 5]ACI52390.1 NAD(P)H dehydrogenase (quinone) [Gluconacetobacter diazotrophicus PA1 5]MBB2158083.1 FMN-dependent NADH-azoreductase [Gluconacetobacter diazotrophicus]TWB05513.1 FMN-depen